MDDYPISLKTAEAIQTGSAEANGRSASHNQSSSLSCHATDENAHHFALKRKVLLATVNGLAQNMLNNFERRRQFTTGLKFNDVTQRVSGNRIIRFYPICVIAILLGPHFKLIGFGLSVADCQEIKEKVLEMMKKNPPPGPELDGSCAADDSAKKDDPTHVTPSTATMEEFIQADLALLPPINEAAQATFTILK
jgi:hypothetical protein